MEPSRAYELVPEIEVSVSGVGQYLPASHFEHSKFYVATEMPAAEYSPSRHLVGETFEAGQA